MKVWILTREINQYDQDGEYFVAVFSGKPHHSQLMGCGVTQDRLRHVLAGGGRVKTENEWFYLRECEANAPVEARAARRADRDQRKSVLQQYAQREI